MNNRWMTAEDERERDDERAWAMEPDTIEEVAASWCDALDRALPLTPDEEISVRKVLAGWIANQHPDAIVRLARTLMITVGS